MHEQLLSNPPSPKFHLIFDAVGDANVPLYTYSEGYLAPNGLYLTVAPAPTGGIRGIMKLARLFWEVNRPRILGGTNRQWRLVCFYQGMAEHVLTGSAGRCP